MLSHLKRGKAFYRGLLRLALPIVLQNIVASSLGILDTFMVGSLGEEAMAAVTVANIPIFMLQLIVFGMQSGSSVLFAQFWGKRDTAAINRVLGIGLIAVGVVSGVFALIMFCFPLGFMRLFTNEAATAVLAAEYARIVGGAYVLGSISQVYVAAHRSMENPKIGFYLLSISMTTDTFLNWVLIYGNLGAPRMGVAGAALSTLIARALEFIVVAVYAVRTPRFRLRPSLMLRPGGEMLRRFLRYASPVVLNETLWGLGAGLYPTIMGHMQGSTQILAGFALSRNIEMLCTAAVFAIANAAAIVIGKEIGGGRSRQEVHSIGVTLNVVAFSTGLLFGFLMIGLTLTVLPPLVYPFFQLSEEAARITTMMLIVMASALSIRAVNAACIVGIFRGGGDVRAAGFIDLLPMWLFALPASAIAGLAFRVGITAVTLIRQTDELAKFILSVHRFRSRKWIHDVTRLQDSAPPRISRTADSARKRQPR